jgi:hypothetical protein
MARQYSSDEDVSSPLPARRTVNITLPRRGVSQLNEQAPLQRGTLTGKISQLGSEVVSTIREGRGISQLDRGEIPQRVGKGISRLGETSLAFPKTIPPNRREVSPPRSTSTTEPTPTLTTRRGPSPPRRNSPLRSTSTTELTPTLPGRRISPLRRSPSPTRYPNKGGSPIRYPSRKTSPQPKETVLSREEKQVCTKLEEIIIIEVLEPRDRAIIAFGEKNNIKLALKFTPPDLEKDNSLSVERQIYREMVPVMLKQSPHFVKYIDDFSCSDMVGILKELALKLSYPSHYEAGKLWKLISDMYQEEDLSLSDRIYVLVTEKAPGHTLHEWITSTLYTKLYSEEDRKLFDRDVSLQVAHTLNVMAENLVMHNDLHNGNIFIEEVKEKVLYRLNGEPFKSKYFVRIYDFDHSAVQGKIRNRKLDNSLCLRFAECSYFTPKLDWFTFLELSGTVYSREYFPLLKRLEKFGGKGQRVQKGKVCICQDSGCEECLISEELLEKVPSMSEFIEMVYR